MIERAGDVHAQFRTLPFSTDDPLLHGGRAMILAPHADDESLGCGGLIAGLCERSLPPFVLVATDGAGSHPGSRLWPADRLRALRESEALQATASLGLRGENLGFLRLRDTAAPHCGPGFERACRDIAALALRHGCDTLIAPWLLDPHCDHQAVQKMARQVARSLELRLLSYPVWGWLIEHDTEIDIEAPIAGFRLDIGRHLARKIQAIRLHASQYSDLIVDDPNGFRLPPALLSAFEQPWEVFLETR